MVTAGWSRAAACASAMPSMTGMRMSVSSSSNRAFLARARRAPARRRSRSSPRGRPVSARVRSGCGSLPRPRRSGCVPWKSPSAAQSRRRPAGRGHYDICPASQRRLMNRKPQPGRAGRLGQAAGARPPLVGWAAAAGARGGGPRAAPRAGEGGGGGGGRRRRRVGRGGGAGGGVRGRGGFSGAWVRGPARPHVPHRAALVPVPHRPVRRRQDSLLRLLFLSLQPTRGLITLFGQDVATLARTRWRRCAGASASCSRISGCSTT